MSEIQEIGGNKFTIWRGKINGKISNFFKKRSDKLIQKGSKISISNPSCKFINHCTIMFNFTVNNTDKYQLVHQGIFTEKYKDWRKKVEEHESRVYDWENEMIEWESEDKDKRGAAPTKPEMENSPLNTDEMFQTIILLDKKWYKKDIL